MKNRKLLAWEKLISLESKKLNLQTELDSLYNIVTKNIPQSSYEEIIAGLDILKEVLFNEPSSHDLSETDFELFRVIVARALTPSEQNINILESNKLSADKNIKLHQDASFKEILSRCKICLPRFINCYLPQALFGYRDFKNELELLRRLSPLFGINDSVVSQRQPIDLNISIWRKMGAAISEWFKYILNLNTSPEHPEYIELCDRLMIISLHRCNTGSARAMDICLDAFEKIPKTPLLHHRFINKTDKVYDMVMLEQLTLLNFKKLLLKRGPGELRHDPCFIELIKCVQSIDFFVSQAVDYKVEELDSVRITGDTNTCIILERVLKTLANDYLNKDSLPANQFKKLEQLLSSALQTFVPLQKLNSISIIDEETTLQASKLNEQVGINKKDNAETRKNLMSLIINTKLLQSNSSQDEFNLDPRNFAKQIMELINDLKPHFHNNQEKTFKYIFTHAQQKEELIHIRGQLNEFAKKNTIEKMPVKNNFFYTTDKPTGEAANANVNKSSLDGDRRP